MASQAISWHWIFFVNLPIGAAAALLTARLVRSDRGIVLAEGADVAGAFLVTAALMLGVYTIVETARYGWNSAHTVGFGAVAILLLAGFVARQATAINPLLPLRMFRSRNVSAANLIQFLMVAGLLGFFFLSTLYLRRVLGLHPLEIGLAFLPIALAIGTLSLGFSARVSTRFGARAVLLPGLTLIAAGLALLTRAPVASSYVVDLLPAMLLLGVGAGLSFPALMTLSMSSATPSDSGLASGLLNTTAQVGGALGLAVLATVATSPDGPPARRRGEHCVGADRRLPPRVRNRCGPHRRHHRHRGHRAAAAGRGPAGVSGREQAAGCGSRPLRSGVTSRTSRQRPCLPRRRRRR